LTISTQHAFILKQTPHVETHFHCSLNLQPPPNTLFDQPPPQTTTAPYLKSQPSLLQTTMPYQRPKVTPPPSSPGAHNNYSLDEFDPRNRMSMSKAHRQPPPAPPNSPTEGDRISSLPASSRIKFSEPANWNGAAHVTAGDRGLPERPPTVLLPSPPRAEHRRLPLRLEETGKGKGKAPMPKLIRHDTEPGQHWWQAGRRMMDRDGNESGSLQDDGSIREERMKVRRSGR
jgi:hypothetical protein